MTSVKKIRAEKGKDEKPAAAKTGGKARNAKPPAGLPAESVSRVPAKSEARVPAKSEAGLPAVTRDTRKAPAAAIFSGPNPYLPETATVAEVIRETPAIVTLRLTLDDPERMEAFSFLPGQVGQVSVFGVGESTFVINSPPSQKNHLQFSVMKAGEVSGAIHKLSRGDKVGLRAPLGNAFPFKEWKGKNVFFIGGGIGMAPIRTIMLHLLDNAGEYGSIDLLYGARSPRDMAYGYETDAWLNNAKLKATLTIDAPSEGWPHKVGLIPNVLLELAPRPENRVAVLCGPPVMIRFTLEALKKLEFPDEQIFTTLEKRMKCGIGICGRCNIGPRYVCVDGPVFSLAELKKLPDEL
jgi:NAD(P)H-flavin reductase